MYQILLSFTQSEASWYMPWNEYIHSALMDELTCTCPPRAGCALCFSAGRSPLEAMSILWAKSGFYTIFVLSFSISFHYPVSEQIIKTYVFISFKEWFQICCQILLHLSQDGKLNMALETKVISIWFQLKPTWNILVFTSGILQWALLSLINASLEELLLLGSIVEP